jgi:hypothetical protein
MVSNTPGQMIDICGQSTEPEQKMIGLKRYEESCLCSGGDLLRMLFILVPTCTQHYATCFPVKLVQLWMRLLHDICNRDCVLYILRWKLCTVSGCS